MKTVAPRPRRGEQDRVSPKASEEPGLGGQERFNEIGHLFFSLKYAVVPLA
jgi:hypothetical protein